MGAAMESVTVSSKFQVVIPLKVRMVLGIQPGEKVHVFPYLNRIELIPERPLSSMRGFLRGIDTEVPREGDRV